MKTVRNILSPEPGVRNLARKGIESAFQDPDARWLTTEILGHLKSIVRLRNAVVHEAALGFHEHL